MFDNMLDADMIGESPVYVLQDKVVKARKAKPCFFCSEKIIKGESYRKIVGKVDGVIETHAYCAKCCGFYCCAGCKFNAVIDIEYECVLEMSRYNKERCRFYEDTKHVAQLKGL